MKESCATEGEKIRDSRCHSGRKGEDVLTPVVGPSSKQHPKTEVSRQKLQEETSWRRGHFKDQVPTLRPLHNSLSGKDSVRGEKGN